MKKILLISLITSSVFSQTSNIFEPIDLFDLEYVSNTEISPSGDKVLYQRNYNDIMTDQSFSNIWLINYDGTNNRPITTGNYKDNSPKWSNQGDKFIFQSNRDSKSQIFLFDLKNNSIQKLTNFQYSIQSIKWSPDDNYILFSSFIDSKRETLIKMPEKPKGAKWNDPPVEISDLNYRYDSSGYRKPGEVQFFYYSS
jgi:acylaminoacyl-peptidase